MKLKILKLSGGMIMGADTASINLINRLKNGVYEFECSSEVPTKKRRSSMQNSYYWGVVLSEIVREVDDSYSDEQFHDMFKGLFFGLRPIGKSYIIGGRTKDLNSMEMEDYLEFCRNWAFETLNLVIPKPNDIGFNY